MIFYGTFQRFSGNGACGAAYGPLRRSLRDLPAGGGPVQHRGPDLHCQRRLSGVLRQRRQHGGVPPDGGGPGHRRDGGGRLLRLCQHGPGPQ